MIRIVPGSDLERRLAARNILLNQPVKTSPTLVKGRGLTPVLTTPKRRPLIHRPAQVASM